MTLLEQAKKARKKTFFPRDEMLELALSALNGEITVAEAQRAIYPNKKVSSGYHQMTGTKLFGSLRRAIIGGQIRIVKAKK